MSPLKIDKSNVYKNESNEYYSAVVILVPFPESVIWLSWL